MGIFSREKPKQEIRVNYMPLCELADFKELQTRVLAFETCVNLIANAVSKCEFQTYKEGKRYRGSEWYLLNVEPNPNQTSSEFLHELVWNLYNKGEVLVVNNGSRAKVEYLAVAESFTRNNDYAFKGNTYTDVVLNGSKMNKTYREDEVLHIRLHPQKLKPILDGIMASYEATLATARSVYDIGNGVHIVDHVDMVANENEDGDWQAQYSQMLTEQIKPFINSAKAVLPVFDGHTFEVMDIGGKGGADSRDIKDVTNDIFELTARALNIPPVLLLGNVAGIDDTVQSFLTFCIDPLLDLIKEEFNRKRYGESALLNGTYMHIDSGTIQHFDIFRNASNIEKAIGSGFMTINEVREAAEVGTSDDPNADQLFITKNFAQVETLKGGE